MGLERQIAEDAGHENPNLEHSPGPGALILESKAGRIVRQFCNLCPALFLSTE